MTFQMSDPVLNAMLDAAETQIGTSAVLKFFTGSPPANCAAANTGTLLSTMNLPSDWMSNAATHSKAKLGTWQDASPAASGVAGYFRIFASDGTTCGAQGTVTATGGGGDITINNTSIAPGQLVVVTGFTINNAANS